MANLNITQQNARVAIIGNGTAFDWSELASNYTAVIAADGGAKLCQLLGVTPSTIIGDGDSYPAIPSPSNDQQTTDLQKCLAYVAEQYPHVAIDLIACFSEDRPDHSLAAALCLQVLPNGSHIVTSTSTLHWLTGSLELSSPKVAFSIIPLGVDMSVRITGAKWNGDDVHISQHTASGISNSINSTNCTIVNLSNKPAIVVVFDHAFPLL